MNYPLKENTTCDTIGRVNEPIWIPWSDPRTNAEKDPFQSRRTSGNNVWDPESLMLESDAKRGMTYENSMVIYPRFLDPAALTPRDVRRVFRVSVRLWESEQPGSYGAELRLPDGKTIYRRGEQFALGRRLLYYITQWYAHNTVEYKGIPDGVRTAFDILGVRLNES